MMSADFASSEMRKARVSPWSRSQTCCGWMRRKIGQRSFGLHGNALPTLIAVSLVFKQPVRGLGNSNTIAPRFKQVLVQSSKLSKTDPIAVWLPAVVGRARQRRSVFPSVLSPSSPPSSCTLTPPDRRRESAGWPFAIRSNLIVCFTKHRFARERKSFGQLDVADVGDALTAIIGRRQNGLICKLVCSGKQTIQAHA